MTRFRFLPACVFAFLLLCPALLSAREQTYRGLSDFARALSIIEKNYVDEISSEELARSAIKGMFDSLDPYSAYLSPGSFRNLEIGTMGEFEGVGIEITVREGLVTVISPIEGSPAEEAGMKPGDVIVSIDGRSMEKTNAVEALDLIRGRAGSRITLSVRREGEDGVRDFAIVRRVVKLRSVKSRLVEKDIGYIKLSQFHRSSADEFLSSYENLETENGAELGGLVVDLRNNPGGLLEQALALCDMFMDEGLILNVRGRFPHSSREYFARRGAEISAPSVAVIVNRGSASASEVLAVALKENGRARLVGTRTFGKGSVQSVMELGGGAGVKITTARFFAPGGDAIGDRGIEPDVVVEDGERDGADLQLARALEVVRRM